MSCSPAQLTANRRNALRSTGPRTPEGKAKSRFNACGHGLAGAGDLVGPHEDAELIASRALAIARELDAPGDIGFLLAHRAALLSVRMKRSSDRELVVIAANAEAARDQFDQDRQDALDGWIKILEDPAASADTIAPALFSLAAAPEGLAPLIDAWEQLRDAIHGDDPTEARRAADRASVWLGVSPAVADLSDRIDAEVARLRRLVSSSPELAAAIRALRVEAGIIASFDPGPEATLARRYEAAAERGMYRALRAIAEIRRERAAGFLPPVATPPPEQPPAPPAPPARPHPEPLGSFRAGVSGAAMPGAPWIISEREPGPFPPEPRQNRPDLRKLGTNRR